MHCAELLLAVGDCPMPLLPVLLELPQLHAEMLELLLARRPIPLWRPSSRGCEFRVLPRVRKSAAHCLLIRDFGFGERRLPLLESIAGGGETLRTPCCHSLSAAAADAMQRSGLLLELQLPLLGGHQPHPPLGKRLGRMLVRRP